MDSLLAHLLETGLCLDLERKAPIAVLISGCILAVLLISLSCAPSVNNLLACYYFCVAELCDLINAVCVCCCFSDGREFSESVGGPSINEAMIGQLKGWRGLTRARLRGDSEQWVVRATVEYTPPKDEVRLNFSEKLGQRTGTEKLELRVTTTMSFTEHTAVALNAKKYLA
eukprot:IDg14059t1